MFIKIEDYFVNCIFNDDVKSIEHLGDVYSKESKVLTFALDLHYFNIANENPNVSTIITSSEIAHAIEKTSKNIVIEEFPKTAFWLYHNYLVKNKVMLLPFEFQIDKTASIHPKAIVHDNVRIGKNVIIEAGAIILENTILQDNVHIHSNAIIGSDGMQVVKDENGNQIFIKHAGGVIIGENVNILSGANVSKAVDLSFTEIGRNSVISIHASIGHNVKIGKNCMLAGNVLVGGSVIIEDNVWIGPSATIKDSIVVGENASIKLGSVVVKNVSQNEEVSGNFAYNHLKRIRNFAKEQR